MASKNDSLQQEIDEIKKENDLNIINTHNSIAVQINLRKSILLQVFLTDSYPKEKPIGIKMHSYDITNLKPTRQQVVQDFIQDITNKLNMFLNDKNDCTIQELFHQAKQYSNDFTNQEYLLESLEILESSPIKYHIFKTLTQNSSDSSRFDNKKKIKEKQNESVLKSKFKGSEYIFDRIKWDESIDKDQVTIGYLDRFKGVCKIKFNDFKGVHEDRDGIPLHRIRYFKINDKIVWDREAKIDLLTGNDLEKYFNKKLVINEENDEIYLEHIKLNQDKTIQNGNILKFYANDWNLEKPEEIKLKPNFLSSMKFLSYNILSKNNFIKSINESMKRAKHSAGLEPLSNVDRMAKIIELFESNQPDFILLQECESYEEKKLKENKFIQNNYIILSDYSESSCVILSKMKPIWFKTLKLCENSSKLAQVCKFQFRTNSLKKVEELIVCNLHLTSGKANNFFEKRKMQLQTIKSYFIDSNEFKADYVLIGGDFNFGFDDESKHENALLDEIFISNGFIDLMPNSYSFDPLTNFSASITSFKLYPRRLDRLFFKSKDQLKCELIRSNLVNTEPFEINLEPHHHITFDSYLNVLTQVKINNVYYLHPSDHYGLEIEFKFKASLHSSNLCHQSTIAVVLPKHLSDSIQEIRAENDPTFNRWPPHFNILYPFYLNIDFNLNSIESHLFSDIISCLTNFEPFKCKMNKFDLFDKNNVVYLEPCEEAQLKMKLIFNELKKLFEDITNKKWKDSLTPHLTIAQPVDKRTAPKGWAKSKYNHIKENYSPIDLEFTVDCLHWMTRNGDEPFKIMHSFTLGKRYPSTITNLNLNNLESTSLIKYLTSVNMILDTEEETKRNDLFDKVITEIKSHRKIANFQDILSIGSFDFAIKCNDFDFCILKFDSNDMDSFAQELSYNLAQNTDLFHIVRNISDANVPIIELNLNSNLISNADIQIYNLPNVDINEYDNYDYMKLVEKYHKEEYNKIYPISALFENNNLKKYIQNYKDFQIVLTFVKHWAKQRQIYGKAFGYLGGISWSLMIANFLKSTSNKYCHRLELNYNDNRFRNLISEFFKFYSTRRDFYKHEAICLVDLNLVLNMEKFKQELSSLTILQSMYPYHNTSKNVNDHNRNILFDEIERAYDLFKQDSSYELICKELDLNKFPYKLSFKIEVKSNKIICHIFTLIKAKLLSLITNLLRINSNLKIRTLTNLDEINLNLFYFYIPFYSMSNLDESSKQLMKDYCFSFISSIKSLSHTSEFDITLDNI